MQKTKNLEVEPELVEDWFQRPELFFTAVTGLKSCRYQTVFLRDKSQKIAMRVGRQGGKSTVVAVRTVFKAMMNNGHFSLLISPTLEQTGILFRKILRIVNTNPWIKQRIKVQTQTRIYFKNESWIYTTSKDTVRGHTPDELIVDEAAFVPDEVYEAAEPSLAATFDTGGSVVYISTPFGMRGKFYQAFQDSSFSTYHVPSTEIAHVSQQYLKDKEAKCLENEFRQEYLAEFVEDVDTYFPRPLVMSVAGDIEEVKEPREGFLYFLGVDIARYGMDETVFIVLEVDPTTSTGQVVEITRTAKKPTTDTMGRIKELHKKWKFRTIYPDETSLGGGVVDVLLEAKLPVKPISFGARAENRKESNKEYMYKSLKWLMENKKIKIPHYHKLINQLVELREDYTASGRLMVKHPERGHDDYPDALALACLALAKTRDMPKAAFGALGKPGMVSYKKEESEGQKFINKRGKVKNKDIKIVRQDKVEENIDWEKIDEVIKEEAASGVVTCNIYGKIVTPLYCWGCYKEQCDNFKRVSQIALRKGIKKEQLWMRQTRYKRGEHVTKKTD